MHELCEITSSKRIYAADYRLEGVPFYRGKEISEKHRGNLDVSTELFIDRSKFEQIRAKFGAPKTGDLLLTSVGTLGSPYVVDDREEFYFKDGNLTWFRNFKNLDSQFLYYWLLSPQGKAELKKCTIGSSQSAYTIVLLKEMEIYLLDFPTQRKIAAILSAYDDLIENNMRRIKILEGMAQNLYREWFVKFRFPGHQQARFTDSPLGPIPVEWECGVVNDLASLKSGFAFKSSLFKEDGTYGLVTIRNVHDGLFVPDCTNRIADLPSNMPSFCHLSTGDVLLSLTGNIGRVCLVYGTDYLLNQRVAKLVPNEATNRAYIYFTFRQDEFQTKLDKIANGVAQQNLSPIETGRMQVIKPSQKVLTDFAGVCEPMVEEMTTLFQKNSTLRRTRDLLLPRLISGELDVSELDITVPEEIA